MTEAGASESSQASSRKSGKSRLDAATTKKENGKTWPKAPKSKDHKVNSATADLSTTVRRPKSPEEQAEEMYTSASQALTSRNWPKAEKLLRQALEHDPSLSPARQKLAWLYVKTGRQNRAERLLRSGLKRDQAAHGVRSLLARLLIGRKAWNDAVAVLLQGRQPSIREKPEHFALLAYAYRKKGDFSQAAELYAGLSRIQPETSRWWLGLGLSQEARDNAEAAARAYATALGCRDLSSSLRDFLQRRLKGLQE